MAYKSVAYKKYVTLFCSLSNMKKYLFPCEFICIYPIFHWGNIIQKKYRKLGVRKKDKKDGGAYRSGV